MRHVIRLLLSAAFGVAVVLLLPSLSSAEEPIRLHESFPTDYQYHVSSRVKLDGSLTLPPDKGQGVGKTLRMAGTSTIEYDEKVLSRDSTGAVQKTARVYNRLEVNRTVGDQPQTSSLRPGVRRQVLLRHGTKEVPFSPDGPLLWSEIDLVRTDVFTPALVGLLPDHPIRPGDRWAAALVAVAELTDFEKVEEGGLQCQFEEVTLLDRRRQARVSFSGSVRGVNEDGPTRQQLDGSFYFDLESNHLSYLSLEGMHFILDKEGKVAGTLKGQFVLTRQANAHSAELTSDRLAGVLLDPTDATTQLLYENVELGVRFLYPRRWRVASVRGRQIAVDDAEGSGFLLTVEPPELVPTGAHFLTESRDWLQKQQARIIHVEPLRQLQGPPRIIEQFAIAVDLNGQRVLMDYFVSRQTAAGATVAARLVTPDAATRQTEVTRIVASLQLSRTPRVESKK